MSARKQVVLTTSSNVAPAAERTAEMFFMTCSVCVLMSSPTSTPLAGSSAICPEQKSRAPALIACEYGPTAAGALELEIILTVLGLISLAVGLFLLLFKVEKQPKTSEMLEERKEFFKGFPIGVVICLTFWVVNLIG